MNARILVVDDDPGIRSLVADFLARYGYQVEGAADAAAAERALARTAFEVAILDVMMPGEDGLSFCRRLAARGGPSIIMLSAAAGTTDRIIGIETGADTYLAKPCDPHELLAHVRSALRRRGAPAADTADGRITCFAGWQFDLVGRILRRPDKAVVALSNGEFALLRAFVEHPNRVLSRDMLLERANGPDTESFDRAIDVMVSRLRRKLDRAANEEIIRTVRSEGYMFMPRVERA